mgnify:CR=1 FL=1
MKWQQEEANIEITKNKYRNLSQQLTMKKSEIRDHTPATSGNFTAHTQALKQLNDEYHELEERYRNALIEHRQSIKDARTYHQDYLESWREISIAEKQLKEEIKKLTELQKEYRTLVRKTNLISIVLSASCTTVLQMNWEQQQINPEHYSSSNCLTYRDLVMFDNTIPAVSGAFVDLGYDLDREKPGYHNTPEYYNNEYRLSVMSLLFVQYLISVPRTFGKGRHHPSSCRHSSVSSHF